MMTDTKCEEKSKIIENANIDKDIKERLYKIRDKANDSKDKIIQHWKSSLIKALKRNSTRDIVWYLELIEDRWKGLVEIPKIRCYWDGVINEMSYAQRESNFLVEVVKYKDGILLMEYIEKLQKRINEVTAGSYYYHNYYRLTSETPERDHQIRMHGIIKDLKNEFETCR